MINRQQFEYQLQHIFRLLLQNKTQEEIAHELNISTRTVARYCQRIDKRYGEVQKQKTGDTLFLKCQLFKNRMLKLYKILEEKATASSPNNTNGHEIAKCCEVAADIAINVLKMESEGIKAICEIMSKNNNTNKGQRYLNNLNRSKSEIDEYDNRKF